MTFEKEEKRYLSFVIIMFLIFQLLIGPNLYVEGFNTFSKNNDTPVFKNNIIFDYALITREAKETSYNFSIVEVYSLFYNDLTVDKFCETRPYNKVSYDIRNEIRKHILVYFNGSKYKGCTSFI